MPPKDSTKMLLVRNTLESQAEAEPYPPPA
jgi:hypothetical protein